MYKKLFNAISQVIEILKEVQLRAEESYVMSKAPRLISEAEKEL